MWKDRRERYLKITVFGLVDMDIKAKFDRAADVFMGKPEGLYEQACVSYKGKEFETAR